MLRRFLPLLAAGVLSIALAACGSPKTGTVTRTTTVTASSLSITYIPPESSRTPEGARPQPPPSTFTLRLHEMHIDVTGLRLIESFEGYDRCAYWDPFGRVWTAGFGQTQGIYQGFCFASRAAAERNLQISVERDYEPAIRALGVAFDQHEWDALCSFVYNLGAGIFNGTGVGADLRARDFHAATSAMLGYVYAGGVVLPGLVTRRRDEVALFDTPVAKPKAPYIPTDERRWRREWDAVSGKHGSHAKAVRARLRPLMLKRARAIESRAHHERDGWLKLNRQARHYELNVRLGLVKPHQRS